MSGLPDLPNAAALSQTAGVADGWRAEIESILSDAARGGPPVGRDWCCLDCGKWTPINHPEAHDHEDDCTARAEWDARLKWQSRLRAMLAAEPAASGGEQCTIPQSQKAPLGDREYEAKYATPERLAKLAATADCDFCGVRPGELHAFDCTALDDADKPQLPAGASVSVAQRLRDAIEGECDGLGITEECAESILRYIGFHPQGRIVGGRKIDGVWVIEATSHSDLMPNQQLVRYDDYRRALDQALTQQASLSSHRQAGDAFDWIIEITGNSAYPVRIIEPAGVNAWEPHSSSLGAKFILDVKKLLATPQPGAERQPNVVLIPQEKRWVEGDSDFLRGHANGYNSALSDVMSVNQGVSRIEPAEQPGAEALRELVQRWRDEAAEIDARGLACNSNSIRARADELESLLARGAK